MKTVVFDLDGTLLDSAPDIIDSLKAALNRVGISCEVPIPSTIVGPPIQGMIDNMNLAISEDQKLKIVRAFRESYDSSTMRLTAPFDGAQDLLIELKRLGWRIFFATNKPYLPTSRLIERFFGDFVDGYCCIDSIPDRKLSKLEMLRFLMHERNIDAHHAIMIGDGAADIKAGSEMGWRTIAVNWGYGEEKDLRIEKPTWWANKMQEILQHLSGIK